MSSDDAPPSTSTSALCPLVDFCRRHDLPWGDEQRDRFETYLDLLQHFNESMNLIGPLDAAEIVRQLLIDSVTPAAIRPPTGTILDVGTGAGLPGIPLKILYPERGLVLVEPRRKRTTFLKIARTRLDLEDVRIERCRIEALDDDTFDYLVAKAFREPSEWLEVAVPRLSDGGLVVCMTSRDRARSLGDAADQFDLHLVERVDDATELGAPSTDRTRSVWVFEG